MMHDYWKYDGLGLAELVRTKQVSAAELVETAIAACGRLNPQLNFMCHDLRELARDVVKRANGRGGGGPFAGVPFLLKDVGAQMKGTPYECGSRLMRGYVSSFTSNLVERFAQAGLITIGKTTTPEFGAQITTESILTGPTRNPWNLSVTPGGSSGGAAAAVAAGVVPVAHANDGLGSIRIPAANCGIFGLKTTRQRTPAGPVGAEVSGGRGVEFVVSRTVRDSAALLDAVHGPDVGAPHHAPPPKLSYVEELTGAFVPLRIAVLDRSFSGDAVHPECANSAREFALFCQRLGHSVEEAAPTVDFDLYRWAIRTAGSASFAAGVAAASRAAEREASPDTLEPLTWLSYLEGRELRAETYFQGLDVFATLQRGLGRFFEQHDVLVTPMLSQPPASLGWLGTPADDLNVFWDKFAGDAYSPFAGIFNVTGQPAASIPWGRTQDQRPLGVQIVGRFGDEGMLIRLAAQVERERPWIAHRPGIHVGN